MTENATSRIASLLIAVSGVWETTQNGLVVVGPGETTPNHLLVSQEITWEYSGGVSESNIGPGWFKALKNCVNIEYLLGRLSFIIDADCLCTYNVATVYRNNVIQGLR